MNEARRRVLLVEDEPDLMTALIADLRARGCEVTVAETEKAARRELERARAGDVRYHLAIVDVMIPTMTMDELIDLDDAEERFLTESVDTGVRICRYARGDLGLDARALPIVVLTNRNDHDLREALAPMGIEAFNKSSARERPIDGELDRVLGRR
jgi:CheY-like chemotaxis protein